MPKFCPSCGEEIFDKVKFCPKCGTDFDSFSLKTNEKSIVEEPKKDIKIEETKIENKKTGTAYNIKNLAVYGVVAIVIVILLLVALSIFSAFSYGASQASTVTSRLPS
jgi:uncharacterized membrane protein YvbJ